MGAFCLGNYLAGNPILELEPTTDFPTAERDSARSKVNALYKAVRLKAYFHKVSCDRRRIPEIKSTSAYYSLLFLHIRLSNA